MKYTQVGGGGGTSQFSAPSDGGNKLALPESRVLGELITSLLLNSVRVHFQGGSVGDLSTREKKSSVTTHGKTSFNRSPLSPQKWLVVLFT